MQVELPAVKLTNYGPFVGKHEIDFPPKGFVLIKGLVTETGGGSGSGKSFFIKSIPFLFGGCPDSHNEIQSWYTEEPPEVEIPILVNGNIINIKRKKGLTVFGNNYQEPIKGGAAENELDKIFGLDKKSRAMVTYRGQKESGLFLSLADDKKKTFLSSLLGLSLYDNVSKEAQEKIPNLELEKENALGSLRFIQKEHNEVQAALIVAEEELNKLPKSSEENISKAENKVKEIQKAYEEVVNSLSREKDQKQEVIRQKTQEINKKIIILTQKVDPPEITIIRRQIEELRFKSKELEAIFNSDVIKYHEKKNTYQKELSSLVMQLQGRQQLEFKIKVLKKEKEELLKLSCPECKRQWIGTDQELKLKEKQELIEKYNKAIESYKDIEKTLDEYKIALAKLEEPIKPIEIDQINYKIQEFVIKGKKIIEVEEAKRQAQVYNLRQEEKALHLELNTKSSEEKKIGAKYTELQHQLNVANFSLDQLRRDQLIYKQASSVVAERKRNLDNLKEKLKEREAAFEQTESKWKLEKDLVALCGKTGFLGAIVEEVLAEISSITNDILSKVANVRHITIDFETEKESITTGNVVARIVPVVYCNGRRVSFNSGISGGMQAAVELAVDLGVAEVVSRRRNSFPGWLILDETFHGLGPTEKATCLEMLQDYAKNRLVLVIDHDTEFQGLFDKVITIEMTGGQSRIVV
jgi:DNA repair exonuclease SbcCD ATPase subunit